MFQESGFIYRNDPGYVLLVPLTGVKIQDRISLYNASREDRIAA